MAAHQRTRGACAYCGREMTRAGMARHLSTCSKRAEAITVADQQPGEAGPLIHLQVQDAGGGQYWLHLEMAGSATLKQLDRYLRAIWLECCGHLSEFSTGGWGSRKIAMNRKVADVLKPGVELVHIYDFGTESVTVVRALEVREGKSTVPRPIALMARNEEPIYPCQNCGAPSAVVCMECIYEHERPGTLCEAHAESHPHEDYGGPMLLVNSPRAGMCGYEGPAEPPY
jgi:hypothetical protein